MFQTAPSARTRRPAVRLQWVSLLVLSVGAFGCGESVVDAPPNRVVFENEMFRILDVNLPPGTTLAEHAHEYDLATIVMSEGGQARSQDSGEDWSEAASPALGSVSTAEYTGRPGAHRVQNMSEVPYLLFGIENLRDGGWATPAPLSGRGTTLAAESRAFGVYDVRLAEQTFQVSHTHDVPAVAVMVRGRSISQGPELPEGSDLPAGVKQLDAPGQWVYVPPGEPHYVVRLGVDPLYIVEIELR